MCWEINKVIMTVISLLGPLNSKCSLVSDLCSKSEKKLWSIICYNQQNLLILVPAPASYPASAYLT